MILQSGEFVESSHMKNKIIIATLLLIPLSLSAQQSQLEIQRLDWLIGDWSFDDTEVNGDYQETGT